MVLPSLKVYSLKSECGTVGEQLSGFVTDAGTLSLPIPTC